MTKRTAPIRVVSLILLAASGALCQNGPSADWLQGLEFDGSNSSAVQHQDFGASRSLPDAPSAVQPASRGERLGVSVGPSILRETASGQVTSRPRPNLTAYDQPAFTRGQSSDSVRKNLHPPLFRQSMRYLPSTSTSLMGRASYAASRILFTREGRPNTSYFLGVLASAASARPLNFTYWARSPSATFNDFGSTIGGDAGINLLHEFAPGIRQMVKGLTPNFVSRIEGRISHDQARIGGASIPAK
jgi:hypothetical protein